MAAVPAGIGLADLGGILGGAGGFLGGVGSLFGGGQSNTPVTDWALFNNQQNLSWAQLNAQEDFQRQMAQSSIQWRVQDARAAGVSPLAALGAPTYSPTVSAPPVTAGSMLPAPRDSLGDRLGRAGANIGDAISKTLTTLDKSNMAAQIMQQNQQLKSNDLDIAIKAAQLAKLNKSLQEPAAPTVVAASGGLSGQGGVRVVPDTVVAPRPGDANATAGDHSPTRLNVSGDGGTYATPTDAAVINNPSVTNPFLWQWGWNRYAAKPWSDYQRWVDRNITNPIRSVFGWEPYVRGK